jgi:DNA-binding transcriptional ArsR family regulator
MMLDVPDKIPWLHDLAHGAERYVREVLDAPLTLRSFDGGRGLPYFLQDRYQFLQGELLGQHCVFMAARTEGLDSPANVAKHVRRVQQQGGSVVVLLVPTITAYNRRRLIAQRINFLAPAAQLFLPELAVDLREHYRAALRPTTEVDKLSPTSQMMIIIGALDAGRLSGLNATSIAAALDVSAMSISRAFDELRATDLVTLEPQAREHRLYFTATGRELWGRARPRLRSPVRKIRGADFRPKGATTLLAGESALAHYTSLAEPARTTFAIHASDWKRLALDHALDMVEMTDDPPFLVETWSYDPKVLAKRDDLVDPLSLYLSLNLVDERVEIAAEELLEAAFQ